jgi:hypothetical protein
MMFAEKGAAGGPCFHDEARTPGGKAHVFPV